MIEFNKPNTTILLKYETNQKEAVRGCTNVVAPSHPKV